MENQTTNLMEFEMKEDLQDSIKNNPDIEINDPAVEVNIQKAPFGTLLEVEKTIGSNIVITSVKEVNDDLLTSAFG